MSIRLYEDKEFRGAYADWHKLPVAESWDQVEVLAGRRLGVGYEHDQWSSHDPRLPTREELALAEVAKVFRLGDHTILAIGPA